MFKRYDAILDDPNDDDATNDTKDTIDTNATSLYIRTISIDSADMMMLIQTTVHMHN